MAAKPRTPIKSVREMLEAGNLSGLSGEPEPAAEAPGPTVEPVPKAARKGRRPRRPFVEERTRTSIMLDPPEWEMLDGASHEWGISKSDLVQRALVYFLKSQGWTNTRRSPGRAASQISPGSSPGKSPGEAAS